MCASLSDRLVLVGNHHDAWVMGAADPSSASAILMEMIRVVGEALKKGLFDNSSKNLLSSSRTNLLIN